MKVRETQNWGQSLDRDAAKFKTLLLPVRSGGLTSCSSFHMLPFGEPPRALWKCQGLGLGWPGFLVTPRPHRVEGSG